MRPDIVVDIGNSRIKWGRCEPTGEVGRTASLPDDVSRWQQTLDEWELRERPLCWAVASVQPQRAEQLTAWLEQRGDRVVLLRQTQLPLEVALAAPERVGIDRLLNAVAAKSVLPAGRPAVLIDAGSAVTVDWLDEQHRFQGGAIFPGMDLMAQALHRYTALLPLVQVTPPVPRLPAGATVPAIQVGIFLAVSGGIREAVRRYTAASRVMPRVFFTGGQAQLLSEAMELPLQPGSVWEDFLLWPEMTLVGVQRSVEGLP
jgi:type III pantothenate kinase